MNQKIYKHAYQKYVNGYPCQIREWVLKTRRKKLQYQRRISQGNRKTKETIPIMRVGNGRGDIHGEE